MGLFLETTVGQKFNLIDHVHEEGYRGVSVYTVTDHARKKFCRDRLNKYWDTIKNIVSPEFKSAVPPPVKRSALLPNPPPKPMLSGTAKSSQNWTFRGAGRAREFFVQEFVSLRDAAGVDRYQGDFG